MRETRRLVPLHRLAVFEAAARHGSFSTAARELGMTQSAVSHQIADLEAELGVVLFQRVWRGVTTTEPGAFLFDAARRSLAELTAAVEVARAMGRRSQLTVLTDFGFAAFWLMPRLALIRETMPDVDVRVITAQGAADLDTSLADVAVLFGTESWPRSDATRLVGENVVPVASPGFLAARPIRSIADLAGAPLLHLERPDANRWLSWDEYLAACGAQDSGRDRHANRSELSFNNYMLVMQAAIAGQGVALGWRPLVDDLLRQGLVAEVPAPRITTERGYFLIAPARAARSATSAAFKGWMTEQFEQGA